MAVIHSLYRGSGVVTIDRQMCKKCGECVRTCPNEVLVLDDEHVRFAEDDAFGCISCGHCMMVCPEGSITVAGRSISPQDLVELPPPQVRASADDLSGLMLARRSVRRFRDKDVAPELLERIVDVAASAPMGIPPWDVGCVIVPGREKVRELASEIIEGYVQFLRAFRPWVIGLMRVFARRATHERYKFFVRPLAEKLVASHRRGRDLLFWDAPVVMIFHHSPYAEAADALIACTYAMLAAESLGLGTTMIGSATPVIERDKGLLRKLSIPDGNAPAIALIVGHPAARFGRAVRRRFAHVSFV